MAQSRDGVAVRSSHSDSAIAFIRSVVTQREFGILLFLILAGLVISFYRPSFYSTFNLLNMGRQMAVLTIMAIAMTFLIISQELDLSVGSTFGLTSFTMGLLARDYGWDLWLAFCVALLIGAVIGLINGVITTYGRIPSFITTLGMLGIIRGITLFLSPWPVNRIQHPTFFEVLSSRPYGIPIQIFWMLLFVILGTILLNRTTFGYYVRAVGSNRQAAELSGIRVRWVKISAFVMVGMAAAFAGALSFAHVNSVSPTAGQGMELTVIAAVIIGGTNLFGGEGSVLGTFLGAALLTVIRNGLVQLGGDGRLQDTFLGIIIIVAVLVHTHIGQRWR